ncbi:hypothetical protein ACLIYM_20855 [Streptomyces fenghuangensis]
MTVRAGEPFDTGRAVSDVEELLGAPLPEHGPTVAEGDPDTGEWSRTRGGGFLIAPIWESEDLTGVYGSEWEAASETAESHLDSLTRELERRWGGHRKVSMRVPLFRRRSGEPVPPLFGALCDEDCYGDLAVWGPVRAGGAVPGARRWVGVSLNQSDGDAPMIMVVVVSDSPVTEPEE